MLCVNGPETARAQQQATGATFGQVIGLGGTPSDIVLDELRGRLYLVNNHSNRVDIYGIPEKALVGSIAVGLTPLAGAMSMDGAFLYVTNQQSSSISVIDLGSLNGVYVNDERVEDTHGFTRSSGIVSVE